MLELEFDYAGCVATSERVYWKLDELFPKGTALDFSKPFMPDALVGASGLEFLTPRDRLQLSQIRGNSYLHLFQFVEEYIVATALRHAQAEVFGEEDELRALLRFAEEEVKHQQLFKRYAASFRQGFGGACGLIDNAEGVAGVILDKSPLAVLLITLHIELMTQQHFVEAWRQGNADGLDPLFASLLKHHWLEEAQHAKIDALELDKFGRHAADEAIGRAVDDYCDILLAFDGLLGTQAKLDVDTLEEVRGTRFTDRERVRLLETQHRSLRRVFLVMGMTNPQFVTYLERFGGRERAAKVAALAPVFS